MEYPVVVCGLWSVFYFDVLIEEVGWYVLYILGLRKGGGYLGTTFIDIYIDI